MNNKCLFVLVLALTIAIAITGCGGTPSTPTKVAATTAPSAITVVITATPPPPTLPVATLTPVPTAALTTTTSISTPVALNATATPVPGTPRPAATRRPTNTPTKVVVAPTAIQLKFAAPKPLEPIFGDTRKDERHYPGDALVFKWTAVGAFAPDECYLVSVTLNPGQGDQFVTGCGDSTKTQFVLNQPNRIGPTYASLLPNTGSELWVVWYVTVVKNLGLKPDNVHHNTAPLSPPSAQVQFLFKGS